MKKILSPALLLICAALLLNACLSDSDEGLIDGDLEDLSEYESDAESADGDINKTDGDGDVAEAELDAEAMTEAESEMEAESATDADAEPDSGEIESDAAELSDVDYVPDGLHIIPDKAFFMVEEHSENYHYQAFRLKNFTSEDIAITAIRLSDDTDEGFYLKDDLPVPGVVPPYGEVEFKVWFERPGTAIYKGHVEVETGGQTDTLIAELVALSNDQYECKSGFYIMDGPGSDLGELREAWRYGMNIDLGYTGMEGSSVEIDSVEMKAYRYHLNDPYYDEIDGVAEFLEGPSYSVGPFTEVGDGVPMWGRLQFGLYDFGEYFMSVKIAYTLHPSKDNCYDELPETIERDASLTYFIDLPWPNQIDPNAPYQISGQNKSTEILPWEGLEITLCSEERSLGDLRYNMNAVWSDGNGLTFFGGEEELWTLDERTPPDSLLCSNLQPGVITSLTGSNDERGLELWAGLDGAVALYDSEAWITYPLPEEMISDTDVAGANTVFDVELLDGDLYVLTGMNFGRYSPASDSWSVIDAPQNLDRDYGLHSDGAALWIMAGTELYRIDASGAEAVMDACDLDLKYHYEALVPPAEVIYMPDEQPCHLGELGVIGAETQAVWIAEKSGNPTVWRYDRNSNLDRVISGNGGGYRMQYGYIMRGGMGGYPLLADYQTIRSADSSVCSVFFEADCESVDNLVLIYPGFISADSSESFNHSFFCSMYCGYAPNPSAPQLPMYSLWRGARQIWQPYYPTRVSW